MNTSILARDYERFNRWWLEWTQTPDHELISQETAFKVFMEGIQSTRRPLKSQRETIRQSRRSDQKTILYVLQVHGAMSTYQIHEVVRQISTYSIANYCRSLEIAGLIYRDGVSSRPYDKRMATPIWRVIYEKPVKAPIILKKPKKPVAVYVDPEHEAWMAQVQQQRQHRSRFNRELA